MSLTAHEVIGGGDVVGSVCRHRPGRWTNVRGAVRARLALWPVRVHHRVPSAHRHLRGLVNVALVDTTVQIPVAVAANICDVSVAVLSTVLDTRPATLCDAAAAAHANG